MVKVKDYLLNSPEIPIPVGALGGSKKEKWRVSFTDYLRNDFYQSVENGHVVFEYPDRESQFRTNGVQVGADFLLKKYPKELVSLIEELSARVNSLSKKEKAKKESLDYALRYIIGQIIIPLQLALEQHEPLHHALLSRSKSF